MKKQNYFENDNADAQRSARTKKKKKNSFAKGLLTAIAIIVIALGAFVGTIKLMEPDFDLLSLVPESVQTVLSREETTTAPTTEPTTQPTTTEKPTAEAVTYLAFKQFEMNTSKQGNQIGNLLNGGKVATDYNYIYHIAKHGIYRLEPDSETYARVYKTDNTLSCMNLRGDYLYFVDETEGKLLKMAKGSSAPKTFAENVKFVYVYDDEVYYITTTNDLRKTDTKGENTKTLYSSADDEMRFVGISKKRVFFAVTNYDGTVNYLTVTKGGKGKAAPFCDSETEDSKLVMENGFMYFLKKNADGQYDVCRRKFGSQRTVTLANDSDGSNYIAVENNRLYYSELKDGAFSFTEINMNSGKSRYLMTVKDVSPDHTLHIFHGGEYDFVIGEKSAGGKKVYRAGCMYTGSTNYMKFSDGSWRY